MTLDENEFEITLIVMNDKQETEKNLKRIGYAIGLDFQTNRTRYLIHLSDGKRIVHLNSRDFPYMYGE